MPDHKFEFDAKCKSCKGTGLFAGMAEHDGMAVVCYKCKGAGTVHHVIRWDDPPRVPPTRDDVAWVIEKSAGIGTGINDELPLGSFGGMSYQDWREGKPFVRGMEMRAYACPAIWYQGTPTSVTMKWDECVIGAFQKCSEFANMADCWARYDKEQA